MNLLSTIVLALFLISEPADMVVENARVWSAGEKVGFATFIAVRDGRFVHVGERDESFIGPKTQRIDAQGKVVIPGLIDAHIHMLSGGLLADQLELRDAMDKSDFIARVRQRAGELEVGQWILGGRWSTESWSDPTQPTKQWIDEASEDHPMFLSRMDGHSALVNSTALKIAGITKDGPPDPEGGVIDRDAETGEPTGILREAAMNLVRQHIPSPTIDQKVAALHRAAQFALQNGITAVGDICSEEDLPAYARWAKENRKIRVYLYVTANDWPSVATEIRDINWLQGWVEARGLKAYMDGSLGSRTAYMREPFMNNESHRPNWRGLLMEGVEDGRMVQNLFEAKKSDFQPIVHAIGDEANHLLVDLYESVYLGDIRKARPRSEHAQHLLPNDIKRFAKLGVIASMQPYHKADDGRYAESYIGSERAKSSYAYRSLLDAGAIVAFGSDWPVVTLNPFKGIEAAVTARTLDGKVWQSQQNITVAQALTCYTAHAAYALFAEDEIGLIKAGYRADFMILTSSPFDPDVVWDQVQPTAVFVEGKNIEVP
jgi:predicted amidohydrolase YtcJ